jgi:Membrane-associated lipoprotein involved in thiamine biosynthesis
MKVLLYTEGLKTISKSGLGKAIKHQMKALDDNKVEYTTNLKDDYDVLHINFYGPKSYFFAKKAKKNGKKIVYHAHSTEEDFRNSFLFSNLVAPLFKKWLIKCYKLGDQLVTPTEYSKRLLENYNMGRPIKAISNGVEIKFFERNEMAGKEFRKQYGYTDKDKIIVGIGLYIKRKGIIDFVELAKRLPDYKFIWFGYSPLWASPKEIKKAVNTKLPNLHFAGYVDSSIIKSSLSGADLYLFPTLEETEGIPIIEALTSKIPALIRDIPVFEEYEANKVVYKAADIDEFEKMIPKIINKKLPNLTEEGYKMAKKKDVKAVGKELIKTYEDTLKMPTKKEEKKEINDKNFKMRTYGMIIAAVIFMIAAFFASDKYNFIQDKELTKYSKMIYYMDTYITVNVYTNNEKEAVKALAGVENIYKEYHILTDRYDDNGILYYIHNNKSEDEVIKIDPKLYELLEYSIEWHEKSGGRFNINIGDLTDVWKKYRDEEVGIPSANELEQASKNIDIKNIVLLENNTIKNTHPNIDLGAISKGYATEKAGQYLEENGIKSYLINAGGNVLVGNYYTKKGSFIVGIASPFKDNDSELLSTVTVTNKAVVTSGSYQRYYEYKGKTYGHIIDPVTKYPAEHMVGVTVIAEDSALADLLSTTLFLMTIPEGQEYIKQFENVEAIWAYVTDDGDEKFVISDNFYGLK